MLLLPQRLLDQAFIDTLWQNGKSFLLQKSLSESTLERHGYLSTHAFSYVSRGEQRVVGYEGEQMRIRAGEIGFLPRGMYTITDLVAGEEGFETLLFFLQESMIEQILSDTPNQSEAQQAQGFWKMSTSPLIASFVQELKQDVFMQEEQAISREVYFELQLVQFLWLLLESDRGSSLCSHLIQSQKGQWRNLKGFMEAHYDKPLTVADFAYLTGRSLSSFHREFRRRFGTSPRQWIRNKRLERSQVLLSQEGATVTDTVFAVGYQHVSNFHQGFQAQISSYPKAIRSAAKRKKLTPLG